MTCPLHPRHLACRDPLTTTLVRFLSPVCLVVPSTLDLSNTVPATATPTEAPVEAKKTFTLKQVSTHTDRNDLWMIINGKVYDISSFVDEHP